jgi:hypothetical protein
MHRKAKAGHVTGGRVFGYDNVDVLDANGKRSHVERRINETEAVIVRRIFSLRAEGVGQTRIAKTLNAGRAIAPRSQQGRPRGWARTTVHEILFRDLYRGVVTWNRSRKRNAWGAHQQTARPAGEWLSMPAPALRIVSDDEWRAAHRRIDAARAQYERDTHGERRPKRDRDSKYLLTGFGRCALCRGGLHVRSRSHGRKRMFFYACTSHYNRGPEVCAHVEQWPMAALDREVLAAIAGDVLRPSVVDEVVAAARQMHEASSRPDDRDRARRELQTVDREQARLTDAIAAGADVPAIVDRLRTTESRRRELVARLEALQTRTAPAWSEIERRLRQSLTDWRSLLEGDVGKVRTAFRQLLTTPIMVTPFVRGKRRGVRFEGRIGLLGVLGGELVTKVASPTGTGVSYDPVFRGEWIDDRYAA